MKHYKAIIIDGKKIRKRLAGIVLLAVFLCLTVERTDLTPRSALGYTLPAVSAVNGIWEERLSAFKQNGIRLLSSFLSFEPGSPKTILSTEIPLAAQINSNTSSPLSKQTPAETPVPSSTPVILAENQGVIKAVDLSVFQNGTQKPILGNQTSYSVDMDAMRGAPPTFDFSKKGPKVLIIHTHATESYSPEGGQFYDKESGDRSQNTEENVVRVGKTMADILNKKGIPTLHDTDLHDYPSFNGSYAHSLAAIEAYLKSYPSIQMVLDLHRDAIVYADGTKARPVTQINGKPAAQLMFVVGTDEKGLYHPHWRENLRCAIHLQDAITKKYPSLMRHINLRQERFNGHTTKASLIIEVGSGGNSLSEAEHAISLAAECIADFLKL
ncbi:MAG: stage II sporulation protein P [Clostridia bacterium]|nr:stage II sporulation protein P [Clostridia bacterium]